jgi:hypothetical protein
VNDVGVKGGDWFMKMTSVVLVVVLSVSLFLVGTTSSASYDPWIDLDDDGDIDIFDIVQMAGAYGTTGTPINKTALLLEMQARIDVLNATVSTLNECVVVTGSKPYNAAITYTLGTGFIIDVSDSVPSGFALVSAFATGRKTDLGGTTLDEPPLNLLPRVSGTSIEIRVWDAEGFEYDNWSGQRAHVDYTLFCTK